MNIAALRLHNQQIARTRFSKPEQVVAWLGGMQGQDHAGAKWSIGLRLSDATDADVERAIGERKILRTWPMRGNRSEIDQSLGYPHLVNALSSTNLS